MSLQKHIWNFDSSICGVFRRSNFSHLLLKSEVLKDMAVGGGICYYHLCYFKCQISGIYLRKSYLRLHFNIS